MKIKKTNFSLGAVHDGTGSATGCPSTFNNIMTPVVGHFSSGVPYLTFSNCSVNSFKSLIFSNVSRY
jgi:hypothetical protein